ncbi:nucleotidyl transferase AbiEii/AbiGii toxin family protein, partial [Microgenomates group bacterium]|nr:nucleotidyl transferase AbiEii/AbiGii toxin family protein [Microgenomates group bacterium]
VKLSFFMYPYRMLYPFLEYSGVKMADLKDIACMKLDAISRRGTKRDFIDLFFICQQFELKYLLKLFEKKFQKLNVPIWHVIKSLIYYEDAEKNDLPKMLVPVDWEEVKQYFQVQVKQLAQQAGLV